MFQIRQEILALTGLDKLDFRRTQRIEIDDVGVRILRAAELLRQARAIAERN